MWIVDLALWITLAAIAAVLAFAVWLVLPPLY